MVPTLRCKPAPPPGRHWTDPGGWCLSTFKIIKSNEEHRDHSASECWRGCECTCLKHRYAHARTQIHSSFLSVPRFTRVYDHQTDRPKPNSNDQKAQQMIRRSTNVRCAGHGSVVKDPAQLTIPSTFSIPFRYCPAGKNNITRPRERKRERPMSDGGGSSSSSC